MIDRDKLTYDIALAFAQASMSQQIADNPDLALNHAGACANMLKDFGYAYRAVKGFSEEMISTWLNDYTESKF